MKYLKMLGLALIAAAALTSFIGASTASATVLYKTTPSLQTLGVGTILDFSLQSGTSASLVTTAGESLDTCTSSTVKGKITNEGSATTTTTGEITELTWGGCTFPTVTLVKGKLEVHHIAGTTNGLLTADGETTVTINTVFFGSCIYGVTAGTTLGELTGGDPAIFHANAVAKKISGSGFTCPETSKWTATYVSTEPTSIDVEAS
jgi:hypothetical protein